jgi:hypothetical protein
MKKTIIIFAVLMLLGVFVSAADAGEVVMQLTVPGCAA